jgi:hypothetical protein
MKKVVFKGKSSTFSNKDFERLMKQINAKKLAKEYFPPFSFEEEGTSLYNIYSLPEKKIIIEYYNCSTSYFDSEITVLGNLKEIKGIEREVVKAIAEKPQVHLSC